MTEKSLGLRVSEVIWTYAPGVMACDHDACARAAGEVAGVFGCIVAMMAAHGNDEDKVIAALADIIRTTSTRIQANALAHLSEPGHA